MGLLIDSGVLIAAERKLFALEPLLATHGEDRCFISVITVSELLVGVHRAQDPDVRARRSAFVEATLGRLPALPVDVPVAREHARLAADLAARGTPIGAHDLWLAATCIAHGFNLMTDNEREFKRIPGLLLVPSSVTE